MMVIIMTSRKYLLVYRNIQHGTPVFRKVHFKSESAHNIRCKQYRTCLSVHRT